MPTSIPYDPSLALGNIVNESKLNNVVKVSESKAKINDAEYKVNAYIQQKRSLEMTLQELTNMGIDNSKLIEKVKAIDEKITASVGELADIKMTEEENIMSLQVNRHTQDGGTVSKSIESPIDYNRTQIKKMPLSSDSLNMDAQYFSFGSNSQDASNTIKAIKTFVSSSLQALGADISTEAGTSAEGHVAKQTENNDLAGTLVITASCTHKDAVLLAPFVLDVDKAIRVWNSTYKDKLIKMDDIKKVQEIAEEEATSDEKFLNIISGATYGSSFVGMVHILKSASTDTDQKMVSAAASLQSQMQTGGWFANASGGFGVDSKFANDVKRMLSTQEISSHVTIDSMGSIPVIKSNEVQLGVKQFAEFDPAKMMDKLATLANATSADKETVQQSAAAARTGQQMLQIRGSEIKNVMTGLGEIDQGKNKMLDINSLMTAFEDYAEKALAGNIGVPINYYLKPISRAQLAQMWVAKYYPNKYLTIKNDDGETTT